MSVGTWVTRTESASTQNSIARRCVSAPTLTTVSSNMTSSLGTADRADPTGKTAGRFKRNGETTMKNLTSLALAAALTPALALGISTVALADRDSDDTQRQAQGGEGAGDQSHDEEVLGGQSQRADRDSDDTQRRAQGREGVGEQHLSIKPQGAVYADEIIGQSVTSRSTGNDFGEVSDLVIGQDGRIVGVIVSTGGFLGMGQRDVALPWDQIHHTMEDDELVFSIDMDEDQLRNLPEYERNE